MYRILLLLCFTLHIDINYSQVVETDVELTILVSPFINEIEQMLYVYQLNGNTYTIDDSVRIEPGRDSYVVHASVPYETTMMTGTWYVSSQSHHNHHYVVFQIIY